MYHRISLRENGELQRQNMKKALEKMNEMGVAKWAVIHCPECGFGLDCRTGEYVEVPSLKLPKGFIKKIPQERETPTALECFTAPMRTEAWRIP